MTNKVYVDILEKIKEDFVSQIIKISSYHNIDVSQCYEASESTTNFLDVLIQFYKTDEREKTFRKGLIIELMSKLSKQKHFPVLGMFSEDSPIEYLLLMSLQLTMPEHIWQKAYLMPHQKVCNGKYIVDIALMKRLKPVVDGKEDDIVALIECDGYDYHYKNSDMATKSIKRNREIQMKESVKLFHYSGKDIYANCTQLANEFWEYIEENIFPNNFYI